MGLLGHMVALVLVSKEVSILFSIEAVPTYIPTNNARGFLFSSPFPTFTVSRFFDEGHSDCSEMIPHCSFDWQFSNNE